MRFRLGTSVLVVTMLLSVSYLAILGFSLDYGFGNASAFAGGDGSFGNPYQISNVTELQNMSSDLNAHYILINDIDCSNTSSWNGGLGFSPIGNDTNKILVGFQGISFSGSFDGKGYKIINLTINRSDESYVGLFGNVNMGNFIKNVTLENVNLSAYDYVAGLCGYKNTATISNCNITGFVNGTTRVGGLIGVNTAGTVNNCSSDIWVNGLGNNNGGLLAYNSGSIVTNCSTFGTTFGGNQYTGGVIGYNSGGTLKQSYSYGFTNATGMYAGGLVGYNANNGDIIDCHFHGTMYSSGFTSGGLVGYNWAGTVNNCTSYGTTTALSSQVGGIAGASRGTITRCKAYGEVNGPGSIGGLLGRNDGGTVSNCYSYRNLTGAGNLGGLIGYVTDGTITNCTAFNNVSSTNNQIGGLFGDLSGGTVVDCTAYGDITGAREIGGLIGQMGSGTVKRCAAFGNINSTDNYVGGLIGEQRGGFVTQSNAMGDVNGDYYTGGLIGYMENSLVKWSTAYGNVTCTGNNAAGLIGGILNEGTGVWIMHNTAYGNVTGSSSVGGLVGRNEQGIHVINCTAFGDVIGNSDQVGGLIGVHEGITINCSAYGNINGASYVGGLIGRNIQATWGQDGELFNCSATGDVTGTGDYVGGLNGYNYANTTNCIALGEVSGVNRVGGLFGHNFFFNITESYHLGYVNATGEYVGGLVGYNDNIYLNDSYTFSNVSGTGQYVGGLIGYNVGSITNSTTYGVTNGTGDYVGGLIGYNTNKITNCSSYGTTTGTETYIGGLVGRNNAQISNCTSYGVSLGNNSIGGLVGYNTGTSAIIDNCSSFGNVNGFNANIGGLIGMNDQGTVSYSFAYGKVTGGDGVGGLIGNSDGGVVFHCYSIGKTTGVNETGGLIGKSDDDNGGNIVTNCYSHSNVSGNWSIGGLIGDNSGGTFTNCYSSGNVTGITSVGGLIGNGGGAVNSFWDEETSGQATSSGGTNKTTTEMMTGATFSGAGWDFINIWGIGEGTSYPFFGQWYNPPIIITSDGIISIEDILYYVDYDASVSSYPSYNAIDTWTVTTNASSWLSIDNNGVLTGTPTNSDVGPYWVNVMVRDLAGGNDSHNFSLTVLNINDPPIITTSELQNATEDAFYFVELSAMDIDPTGDILTWNMTTNAPWLMINSSNGNITGTPSNAEVGSYWINVTVDDGKGGIQSLNFTLNVTNINDDPIITTTQIPDAADEDGLYFFDFEAMDIDPTGDIFTWSFISNATWLLIDSATGNLSGTPDDPDIGSYWVNVTVSDGNGGSDTINFTINVTNINDPPMISTTDVTTATEDVLYSVDYEAIDADPTGDTLTWSVTGAESWLNINSGTGVLSGTPENADVGNYWVNVSVSDGKGGVTWHYFPIAVINVNDPPEIITENVTSAMEDELYIVQYDAIDIDPTGDTLTWMLDTDADWLTLDINNNLNGTPLNADVGLYWVNVTVTDSNGDSANQNFTLEVINTNDPPLITTEDVLSAKVDKLYSVDYDAIDIDPTGDTLTWSLESNATWLAIDSSTGVLSGTPTKNDAGKYWVNVSVSDGNGGLDWNNFEITVPPVVIEVNKNPVINTDNVLTAEVDKLYSVDYDATDSDTPLINLSWSITTNATWLTINTSTGVLRGTPASSDVGTFNVNVSVSDGAGGLAFTNFVITVNKPFTPQENNIPKLSNGKMIPSEGDSDTEFTFSVHYTDEDDDALETIQVVIDGTPHNMKLVSGDAGDGVYEYKTKLDEGDHSYYFTASDGTDDAEPIDATPTTSDTARTTPEIEKKVTADDTMMYIAILIVIIIILLLLGLAMRRKKAETPAEEETQEGEETEEDEEETDETEAEAFNCPECGEAIREDMTECDSCGATLEWGEEEIPDSELDEEDLDDEELPEDSEPETDAEPDEDIDEEEEGEEIEEKTDAGEFECPDCGATLGADITSCPDCGAAFED